MKRIYSPLNNSLQKKLFNKYLDIVYKSSCDNKNYLRKQKSFIERAAIFINILMLRQINTKEHFLINYSAVFLRRLMGEQYRNIILALENDLIIINDKYKTSSDELNKAYTKSFKIAKLHELTDFEFIDIKNKSMIDKYLQYGLSSIRSKKENKLSIRQAKSANNFDFDFDKALTTAKNNDISCAKLSYAYTLFYAYEPNFNFQDAQKRIYNRITNFPNSLLPVLQHKNELKYISIDLVSSQFQFLCIMLLRDIGLKNCDIKTLEFIELIKSNHFYEDVQFNMYYGKFERSKVKKLSFSDFLYRPNICSKYAKQIERKYPQVSDYVRNKLFDKSNVSTNSEFACTIQKIESNIMIYKAYKSLSDKFPNVDILTKHDSIICPKHLQKEAETAIVKAFKSFDWQPNYKITPFNYSSDDDNSTLLPLCKTRKRFLPLDKLTLILNGN